ITDDQPVQISLTKCDPALAMQRHREGQSIVAELVPVAQLDTNPRPLSAIGQQDLTDPTIFTVQEK
ncbi:hypothetical protein, partial [Aeromonas veronii]|uniref:hypothetical protein n=1 Tax=Aeromonas veronii TaxID=654 RepID=UPI0022479B41